MPHSARAGGLWTTQSSKGGVGGKGLPKLAVPSSDMAVSFASSSSRLLFKTDGVSLIRHHGGAEGRHQRGAPHPEEGGHPRRQAPRPDGHLSRRSCPFPVLLSTIGIR